MEKQHITIAIDGPAAAGKSTVAKKVASALNFTYIDTGAMYRAVTHAVIAAGLDPKNEEQAVTVLPTLKIDMLPDGTIFCNDEDVTKIIREPLVSNNVSYIAAMKPVRLALIELQRELAKSKSVVMDGRDIGSYVLPDAQVKIFQVASIETRALRRYEENLSKGLSTTLEEVEENLRERDRIDSGREFDPLVAASDSVLLDTSSLTIDGAVDAVLAIVKEKTGLEKQCH